VACGLLRLHVASRTRAFGRPDRHGSFTGGIVLGMGKNGTAHRWFLVVKPDQRELYELLRQRLDGSGVEVLLDRRSRERRRGSLGPAMDRRVNDRRRGRPIALMSVAAAPEVAVAAPVQPAPTALRTAPAKPGHGAVTHRCPTCAESVELELPRFPHPPARVEMEVGHPVGNGRDSQHYVEIAAFTVSGRLILSQRVPARRPG
jgi:hypothetical protein